jgi:hypothetical protein
MMPDYKHELQRRFDQDAIRYRACHQIKRDLVMPLDEGVGVLALPAFPSAFRDARLL